MCKTEVADSAFADCRRLSDIEYGQWDFSDTEDIYISDAPMRKMRRPFFRIKVILKNEPRLESGLSTLFQTNFFRLFFRYCTGV